MSNLIYLITAARSAGAAGAAALRQLVDEITSGRVQATVVRVVPAYGGGSSTYVVSMTEETAAALQARFGQALLIEQDRSYEPLP